MSDFYVGEIRMVAFTYAPLHWAFCNGQSIPLTQNPTLYSLLSSIYGGDNRTYFKLPDLRGRVPLHYGQSQGPGLSAHTLGEMSGSEWVQQTVSQMPAHTHAAVISDLDIGTITATLRATDGTAQLNSPVGNALANANRQTYLNADPDQDMHAGSIEITQTGQPTATIAIGQAGGDQPHYNVQPFTAVNFCIALEGIYPPRS